MWERKNQKKNLVNMYTWLLLSPPCLLLLAPNQNERHYASLGLTSTCVWMTKSLQSPHSTAHRCGGRELNFWVPGTRRARISKSQWNFLVTPSLHVCCYANQRRPLEQESALSWEGRGNIWGQQGLVANPGPPALEEGPCVQRARMLELQSETVLPLVQITA